MFSCSSGPRFTGALLATLILSQTCLAASGQMAGGGTAQGQEGPKTITLHEAIAQAQRNEPVFATALADKRVADLERSNQRAALLPTAIYHNQLLYTQPNGLINQAGQTGMQQAPAFIANNAVHEYASQAVVTDTIGLQQVAALRLATASAARATAELEIARRGLVSTVISLYYGVSDADHRVMLLEQALREASSFTDLTTKREAAREAAHADVVKAQLQQQQRQRDLMDEQLTAQRLRLELAVLLFPDPHTPYSTEAAAAPAAPPARDDLNAAVAAHNPELKSALAALQQSGAEALSARAAYLPDLGLNFNYGIDAPQFARRGPENAHNLAYSFAATVDIPVWDWLSTERRVKQSTIRRDAVKIALTNAQRRMVADLDEAYDEAVTAFQQIGMLDESTRTAGESLRLTRLRYESGEGTVLEVVDAQNQLILVQTAQADGALRYQKALAALQTLTGSL